MTGAASARVKTILATPPLRPGEGRECSLPACVALASGASYDDVMGASGAAFTTSIDAEGWDPGAASPLDEETLARAARAAGVRIDPLSPPFDDEMRALVLDRIREEIEAKLPPLVRGAVGPAEYGLIVGIDDRGPTFFARTYFDAHDDPTPLGWDAFAGPGHGDLVFLDRATPPGRETLARDGVARAIAEADASDGALRAWLAALRDETRWTDPKHGGTAAFADHAMRTILADKRRAAARFLRSVRGSVAPRAGAELLRAAEGYDKVAAAAEKVGTGPFEPAVALRFVEGGLRRAWANALEGILAREAEAHEALRAGR
ncbi:MAG: hypothetical protein KGN00_11875 [Chloroflexota bacterium]|nr:hypothetical protein [Chloroflexota bacterium]MDE3194374.1 hypothetical protein [Chloroflexota bacterium]